MKKHNVRKFNATGDGVHDDRAAIQSAIDATIAAGGGVVFFPAGDYVVGKIPPRERSGASFLINNVPTVPLVFEGEGAVSIIRMAPGPIRPGEHWAMFRVVASENVSFHHLLLHGNRSNITFPREDNTEIHCILLEQAVDVTVQNVEFQEAVESGIVIKGAREAESGRLTIVGNLFVDSGGNGITLRGSTTPTLLAFNQFEGIAKISINCRPSGGPVEDVVIQGNIVKHTSKNSFAVQLSNIHRVQIVSNTILGGEVRCGDLQDFMISNNMIVGGSGPQLPDAGLQLYGETSNGSVTGNIIRAESTSKGIEVTYQNKQPKKIRLAQNTIRSGETGINIVNSKDISVSDNMIERDPDGSGVIGINVQSNQPDPGDSIQIRNNQIRDFQYGIRAVGNNGNLKRLVVVGNQIRGSSPSPAGAAIHIRERVPEAMVYGNQAGPGETPLKLDSGYIVTAAGFAGNRSPEGIVPAEVGSLYTRLDEDPEQDPDLPRLWVKETGTDARGWRPVITAPPPLPNPMSP